MDVARVQSEYGELLERFKALTNERSAMKLGEKHNELTRERNKLRDRMQKLKAQLPDEVVPTENIIQQAGAILGPETKETLS